MATSLQTFEELILNGELKNIKDFLSKIEPGEREKFSKKACAIYKKAIKGSLKDLGNGSMGWRYNLGEDTLKASVHTVLAICSEDELNKIPWEHSALRLIDWEILQELKPIGLEQFGEHLINESPNYFPYIRKLMEHNLSAKPESENYIIGIISSPNYIYSKYNRNASLVEYLNDEKDLLEDLLKVFDVEGTQEDSLASVDKYSSENCNWQNTFIQLAKDGYFEREVLFQKALDALSRDYIQYRSSWFSRFYEAMEPDINERVNHLPQYGLLLGSSIPTTVSFAIKAVKKVSGKTKVGKEFLEANITPVLYAKSKSTVNTAISLIEKVLKDDKTFANNGTLLLSECLNHESSDVQKKAFILIEKYGDRNDIELIQKMTAAKDVIAATNQPLLNKWLGQTDIDKSETISEEPEEITRYQLSDRETMGYPFKCYPELEPIDSIDSLVSQAAYCLEHPGEVLQFEQVINAISTLPAKRDKQFDKDTSALKKRALHFYSRPRYTIPHLQRLHAAFIYAWISQSPCLFKPSKEFFYHGIFDKSTYKQIDGALVLETERLKSVLERISKDIYLPVLSTPSHQGGWLKPGVLIERYKDYQSKKIEQDNYDLILALAKLPAEELLRSVKGVKEKSQFYTCLRIQAGLEKSPVFFEKALKIAVNAFKEPVNPDKTIGFGHGSIVPEHASYETSKWFLTSFPLLLETYFSFHQKEIKRCIEYMDVSDLALKAGLERLLDNGIPVSVNALEFLSSALMVEESSTRGIALEVLIVAIEEFRLDLAKLGEFVASTLHSQDTKPKRLANSLKEVARTSPDHADAVIQLIEFSLCGDGSKAPKGLVSLLELLQELLAKNRCTIQSKKTISYLEAIATGGKTRQIVKQLVSNS